ncbi:hypothetical protein L0152_26200, partial [bacterium]|nr:hypothetical protein [bacterium]
ISFCRLQAQVKNSIYTMFGVGQIAENGFGINRLLGGAGIAFQSSRTINYLNPASYLGILPNSFVMEVGAYGIYNRSKSKTVSQTDGDINLSYFSASLYIKRWWTTSVGIVPFSSVDYEITSIDEVAGEPISFEKNFKGTGGLNRVYWGNSFKIYKGLAVGFNASYIFGPITQTETAASNDGFTGYELKNERTVTGSYSDFGLQYSIDNDDWFYTIGLIYGASKKLGAMDNLEFTYNGITSSLEQDEQSRLSIPKKFGVGVSVKKSTDWRIGFDYEWKNWSTINFSNPNLDTKNSNRFSIGAEYAPSQRNGWTKNLIYRFGENYKNSYL